MNTKCLLITLLALCCLFPSVTSADTQRVISTAELQRLNPQSFNRVSNSPAVESTSPSSRIRVPAGATLGTTAAIRDSATIRDSAAIRDRSGLSVPGTSGISIPDSITISPDEYLVLDTGRAAKAVSCNTPGAKNCIQAPFQFLTMTRRGKELNLSLVLTSSNDLRYVESKDRFVGDIFLQLRDMAAPNAVKNISTAISIAVSGPLDEIKPTAILNIKKTNTFQEVKLEVRNPEEPTIIQLTPAHSAAPLEVKFGVSRLGLTVSVGQNPILGYGLETTTVTVRATGMEDIPPGAISITSKKGQLDQNTITFDEHGVASTTIRSGSVGEDTITAKLSPFSPGSVTVTYTPPWSWLAAVLIGAVLGIALRVTMRMKHPDMKGGLVFDISIGLLGGLFTALLYALGVNILGLSLPSGYSEGLTLLLSGLGGWVFPGWLSKLGSKGA